MKKPNLHSAPVCPKCQKSARLTSGREIYPDRLDLFDKRFYICDGCGDYVGAHKSSGRPLGTLANAELRRARTILHNERLDPMWRQAPYSGAYDREEALDDEAVKTIQRKARVRVYAYLAAELGIEREECHTGEFSLETCRRAWRILGKVDYQTIREWDKERDRATKELAIPRDAVA